MIYALTTDNTIRQVGALPKLWHDGTGWHDWRTDTPATDPADYGWLPVTETPRPDDTAATARYEVGDRCTRGGRLYECLVAHGAEYAGTWGPPQATVWKDLGPA